VAGWADAAPKKMVAYAEAVHRIAARLEDGCGISIEPRVQQARDAELARSATNVRAVGPNRSIAGRGR
jgi:hypothetical protein